MSKKPNLIYVFADQLRYSSVGLNGDNKAMTPNLDALAADCTNLEEAVSGYPVCAPPTGPPSLLESTPLAQVWSSTKSL